MNRRYVVEIEPEVRDWLDTLSERAYRHAEYYADLLADNAETLGEPHSRHLGGKLRELRFYVDRTQVRITYWLAPDRRTVLLTVFRKTRMHESGEIERAKRALAVCEAGHLGTFDDEYDRRFPKEQP